jgi:hypothetical protein
MGNEFVQKLTEIYFYTTPLRVEAENLFRSAIQLNRNNYGLGAAPGRLLRRIKIHVRRRPVWLNRSGFEDSLLPLSAIENRNCVIIINAPRGCTDYGYTESDVEEDSTSEADSNRERYHAYERNDREVENFRREFTALCGVSYQKVSAS